jgi:hypothetical protein
VTSITRLAIVNRGEAAMRAIHAVRELNDARDEPIRVIALYSESERHALFVRQADERYCLGPASAYLDYEGPVSGGRGRVERWDGGTYTLQDETERRIELRLDGGRLCGTAVIRRAQPPARV